VFRSCSIHSNRLAPSRDIALQFSRLEGLKNRLRGGRWRNPDPEAAPEEIWLQASPAVRNLLSQHKILRHYVGEPELTQQTGMDVLRDYAMQS
jgi:hypothetical protein